MNLFREDVTALLPHLRAYARSLTSGDPQLADDIVQDTIVNALRAQHQFTPGTNLKAWLFTILRNRFKSVITRKHVTAEIYDDYLEEKHWVAPEQESRIEILAFKRAFKTLSRTHREVLMLAVVLGFGLRPDRLHGLHPLPHELEARRENGSVIGHLLRVPASADAK